MLNKNTVLLALISVMFLSSCYNINLKEDKKYNPLLIYITYWVMTFTTLIRFVFQIMKGFYFYDWIGIWITIASTFQILAIGLFFYSIWGRIRPVRIQYVKSKGEVK